MDPRGWLQRRRTSIAASLVLTLVVVTLVAYAISADGFARHKAELNDGGIWVTGNSTVAGLAFGRVNKPIGQLDNTIPMSSGGLDVLQDGSAVLGVQGTQVLGIDPASFTAPQSLRLTIAEAGDIALGGGTVATIDPKTGKVRAARVDPGSASRQDPTVPITDLSQLDTTAPAAATIKGAARVAVDAEGRVLVFSTASHSVTTLVPSASGFAIGGSADVSSSLTDKVALTAVGGSAVLLDTGAGRLQVVGHDAIEIPSGAVVQQVSEGDAPTVTFATADGLYQASLSGGAAKKVFTASGEPAEPVRIGSCVLGAWGSGSATAVRLCDDGKTTSYDLRAAIGTPKFRVNRGQVLLNDLDNGNAWDLQRTPQLVTNWKDFDRSKSKERKRDKSVHKGENLRKPKAAPDTLGARPGAITVLHVLDNDASLSGKTLAIDGKTDVTGVNGASVTIAPDLQTLNFVAPPGSTGTAQFRYSIDDGGPSASAAVTVHLRSGSEAARPGTREHYQQPKYYVPANGSIEVPVIADWRDPWTGDALSLKDATATAGTASVSPAGRIRFNAPNSGGMQKVHYEVQGSEGAAVGRDLVFDVEGPNDTTAHPAQAQPDVVTATVGKPVTFNPLANDLPGSDPATPDASVTLAGDPIGGNGQIVTDASSGRVTFTPRASGAQWLTYQAAYGTADAAKGTIRVNVAKSASTKPVAAPDQAALYGGQSALVDVLANDIDPSGGVLTVTSAEAENPDQFQVAVVRGRWLRIAPKVPEPQPHSQLVSYKITNGQENAQGQVAVVWHDADSGKQPVTSPDQAIVRAGASVTIPVLANDFSPTGSQLSLLTDGAGGAHAGVLTTEPAVGNAYAANTQVVYTAPSDVKDPTTVTIDYVAQDQVGNKSDSTPITVQVIPAKTKVNHPPVPPTLEARVIAGDTVRVKLPGGSMDPDGDPVSIAGLTSAPTKGRLVRITANSFDYEAYPGQSGTDTFGYRLTDQLGATSQPGSVRIAVSQPVQAQPPLALPDAVTVAPDRQVTVDVLANDIVTAGDRPTLTVLSPRTAHFIGNSGLLVTPGPTDAKTPVRVTYAISDGIGQPSQSVVTIRPQEGFNNPPVAFDVYGDPTSTKSDTTADVLAKAYDPDGTAGALKIEVQAPQGTDARVVSGKVVVARTAQEQVVPFTLTDTDGGVGSAVIYVPPIKSGPPYVDPTKVVRVSPGGSTHVSLGDVVIDPAGREVHFGLSSQITGSPGQIRVTPKSGGLQVSAPKDYRGPGAIGFPVYDGSKIDDPQGQQAYLVVPVVVGDNSGLLSCPQDPVVVREGGRPLNLDIGSLCHVWTRTLGARTSLKFKATWAQQPKDVQASGPGNQITLTPGSNARAGDRGQLSVSIEGDKGPAGLVNVEVQASPPPTAPEVTREVHSNSSLSIPVGDLASSSIWHPDFKVTGVVRAGAGATATPHGANLDLKVGKTHGVIVVDYSFTDAPDNNSPTRQAQGRVTLIVQDAPATPVAPQGASGKSKQVLLSWPAPANNGAPIQYYNVRWNGGSKRCPATHCMISGLTNGGRYTFAVQAHNAVGDSLWSPLSGTVIPDEKPDKVTNIHVTGISDHTLMLAWSPPGNQTSAIKTYTVKCTPGCGSHSFGGPAGKVGGLDNNLSYTFTVIATNQRYVGIPATSSSFQSAGAPAAVSGIQANFDETGAGDPTVKVSWDALTSPGLNGPKPPRYLITDNGAAKCGETASTTCAIPSQWGSKHVFRVRAVTTDSLGHRHLGAIGTLAPTDVSGTPDSPQDAKLQATGPDKSVQVSWTAQNPRGTNARVECQWVQGGSGGCGSWPAGSGTQTISNLSPGTNYVAELRQCNSSDKCSAPQRTNVGEPYGPISANAPSLSVTGACYNWSVSGDAGGKQVTATVLMDNATVAGPWTTSGSISNSGRKCVDFGNNHTWKLRVVDSGPTDAQPTKRGDENPVTQRSTDSNGTTTNINGADAPDGTGNCVDHCRYISAQVSNWAGYAWCSVTHVGTWRGGETWWYRVGPANANGDWSGRLSSNTGHVMAYNYTNYDNPINECRPSPPAGANTDSG